MKKHTIVLYLIITAYIFSSCTNEDTEYYSALGTIRITNDSTIIESDENGRFLVENSGIIGSAIKDKDRVIVNFTLVNETLPTGINYRINIYNMVKVLSKPVIELTSQNTDSIGNDELNIGSLWLVKDYLNLSFTFYGGEQKHYINLIRYPGEIPTDTIDLEIRHNEKGDLGTVYFDALVSFDITQLKSEVVDSVVLRIKALEYNNEVFEKNITYRY